MTDIKDCNTCNYFKRKIIDSPCNQCKDNDKWRAVSCEQNCDRCDAKEPCEYKCEEQ